MPVRNEKARVFILRIQEKDSELERRATFEEKMDMFDNMLMDCKDTLQVVITEINTEMVST